MGPTPVAVRVRRIPAQNLRPRRHRGALAAGLGGGGRLPSRRRRPRRAVLGGDPAAECHRQPAHGPRLRNGPDRHDRALSAAAGKERAVPAGHRPRLDRRPVDPGEAAQGPGHPEGGAGPRRLPGEGLELEGRERRHDRGPAAPAGLLGRLAAGALHPRSRPQPGRGGGLRASARAGADLPGGVPGQLVPGLRLGGERPGGGDEGAGGPSLALPLPAQRWARRRRHRPSGGGHHPPRNPAGRHGRGRSPGGSPLRGPGGPHPHPAPGGPGPFRSWPTSTWIRPSERAASR